MPKISTSIKRIILVPGLLEPKCAFRPLKHLLSKQFDRVEIFKDRLAFRDPSESVERLRGMIASGGPNDTVGIVTHSFGDWIAGKPLRLQQPIAFTHWYQ